MKTKILILCLSFIHIFAIAQQNLIRYPALSPDGKQIAFVYQGDIWVENLSEKIPVRITINEAYDAFPTWSPDSKQIAFTSDRYGSGDIFVIHADGTHLKRLTFHPAYDKVNSWSIEDRIVFETRRMFAQVQREQEIFYISPKGGNPQRLMDALGSDAVESSDGNMVAFVKGSCRISRQAYQGAANRDIWLYDKKNKSYTQLTSENYNQFSPLWKDDSHLYFISSNGSNIYQLMSMTIKNKKAEIQEKPLTNFRDFGLRYFSFSPVSHSFALESGSHVYLHTLGSKENLEFTPEINIESKKNILVHKTYQGNVQSFSVSPNGKYLLTSIHGNIYITQAKDKDNFTKALTNDENNNINPVWLNDSAVLYIRDKGGQRDIVLLKSGHSEQSDIFKSYKYNTSLIADTEEDENYMIVSNKGDKIAIVQGHGKLLVADIDKDAHLSSRLVLLDSWATPAGICWSPDDKYLAYSMPDLNFNNEIYIQAVAKDAVPVNVSMHPRNDLAPSWSPDGTKLAFTSIRNYGNYDIWYVWLQKKDWEKTMDEWKLEEDENNDDKEEKDVVVSIDFDEIYQRLFQLTSLPGNETYPIFSSDGKYIYFNSNSNEKGKTDLYKIKWDKKDIKEITKGGQAGSAMQLSPDGKYLYMVKRGGKLARLKLSGDKEEKIAIKAEADIDKNLERLQVYKEAWQVINQGFYDPDFHGRDWYKLGREYENIALSASTDVDFADIINWMLGEINASHMGFRSSKVKPPVKAKTGLIGVDFQSNNKGLRITKVLDGSPASKEESRLLVGDIITSVNGVKMQNNSNFYEQLSYKDHTPVWLTINRNGEEKEILIRPVSSLNAQLYKDWVDFNTALVDEYSGGKLGYLHIKAMGWTSFEKFERDLMAAAYGKEGILIDVRFNGGGWTTDYLMAVLNVKQHAYTIPRGATNNLEKNHTKFRDYYAFGERLPFASWTKPSIALCNQNSYSNAEIFSHAYKSNQLGTLVGTPTFGAVISTGARRLMDGSTIRLPYRAWYVKNTDMNMELAPAVPDVIVKNQPDSRAKNSDEQLKKAVELLLQQIKE